MRCVLTSLHVSPGPQAFSTRTPQTRNPRMRNPRSPSNMSLTLQVRDTQIYFCLAVSLNDSLICCSISPVIQCEGVVVTWLNRCFLYFSFVYSAIITTCTAACCIQNGLFALVETAEIRLVDQSINATENESATTSIY